MVYILASLGGYTNITVRFINKELRKQDGDAFNEIKAAALVKGAKIHFKVGVKDLGKVEDNVELIDECDSLILDGDKFDDIKDEVGTLVGLTATPLKDATHSSERDLIRVLGFDVHDSLI